MQASGLKLYLLVLSAEDYELAVSEGTDLKSLASSYRPIEGCSRPRLCYITKEPGSGLGLSIIPIEGTAPFAIAIFTCSKEEVHFKNKILQIIYSNATDTFTTQELVNYNNPEHTHLL